MTPHPEPGRTGGPGLDLPGMAATIAARLREYFPAESEGHRQVLALAEETGEFVGAYRRAAGLARRTGPWSHVRDELADVVITAYVTAHVLGIDLPAAIEHKTAHALDCGFHQSPHGMPETCPVPWRRYFAHGS